MFLVLCLANCTHVMQTMFDCIHLQLSLNACGILWCFINKPFCHLYDNMFNYYIAATPGITLNVNVMQESIACKSGVRVV